MTLAEIERAEKDMQQQWYDLVMAEQQGSSLKVLEQMYDTYILLAEEYNRCCEAFQRENLAAFIFTLILYLYCPIALTYDDEIDFPCLVHRYETMRIVFITCRLYTIG